MASAFFVYGTLRDDCDSNAPWTADFIAGSTARPARVNGFLLLQQKDYTYPFAVPTGVPSTVVHGRLLTFAHPSIFAAKLATADGIEGYTGTPAGLYDRDVVTVTVDNGDGTTSEDRAYIYYQRKVGKQIHVIPSGDWLQRLSPVIKWEVYEKSSLGVSCASVARAASRMGIGRTGSGEEAGVDAMDEGAAAAVGSGDGEMDADTAMAIAMAMQSEEDSAGFSVEPLPSCPHIEGGGVCAESLTNTDVKQPCGVCANVGENMQCLECGKVFCGRYISAHMLAHNEQTHHPLVVGFADLTFWCYDCGNYVSPYNPLLFPFYANWHVSKFGIQPPAPAATLVLQ